MTSTTHSFGQIANLLMKTFIALISQHSNIRPSLKKPVPFPLQQTDVDTLIVIGDEYNSKGEEKLRMLISKFPVRKKKKATIYDHGKILLSLASSNFKENLSLW